MRAAAEVAAPRLRSLPITTSALAGGAAAKGWRVFRSVDDPGEVFVLVEFESADDAIRGRERLLGSGVLDRFSDKWGPTLVEVAEAVGS